MKSVRVDLVSDLICPWCYLGVKRLEAAMAEVTSEVTEVAFELRFRPFLLDASLPAEGIDLREHLRKKYGLAPETMFTRVEEAARSSGIPLDFSRVRTMASTIGGHVLLGAALEKGTQRDLGIALFEAYFLRGESLGDPAVLTDLATRHGFEEAEAHALLSDDAARAAVLAEAGEASRAGIRSVPFVVLDERLAVPGAQSVETFSQALRQALGAAEA